jgi:hypothetical protein
VSRARSTPTEGGCAAGAAAAGCRATFGPDDAGTAAAAFGVPTKKECLISHPFGRSTRAAALEWLRSQPGKRTNLPAAELGRHWGWQRQRASRRLKAWQKAGFVTRRGNVITVADTAPKANIDLAACVAAIVLAGAAAFFSIKGMVVLFPGASLPVVVMASAMEGAKLVTAGWLAQRWRVTALVWRLTLAVLVAGLAVINPAGVYAQLVAAHVGERGLATSAIKMQDVALAAESPTALPTSTVGWARSIRQSTKRPSAGQTTKALAAIGALRKNP